MTNSTNSSTEPSPSLRLGVNAVVRAVLRLARESPDDFIELVGWARNEAVPSDLYRFLDQNSEAVALKVGAGALAPSNPDLSLSAGPSYQGTRASAAFMVTLSWPLDLSGARGGYRRPLPLAGQP